MYKYIVTERKPVCVWYRCTENMKRKIRTTRREHSKGAADSETKIRYLKPEMGENVMRGVASGLA